MIGIELPNFTLISNLG